MDSFYLGSKRAVVTYVVKFQIKRWFDHIVFFMMNPCSIDVLPVELFHLIFAYLSTPNILHAFCGLSDYVDAVIFGYNQYSCLFRSIDRTEFDLVCRLIQPYQITCLRLSDTDGTPGQSKLFFSRFKIEQFTNLRSLDIGNIDDHVIDQLNNLTKLKQLTSLVLPRRCQNFTRFVIMIQSLLPQLRQMTTSYYQLHYLLYCANNIQALDIELTDHEYSDCPKAMSQLIHLKRLNIKAHGRSIELGKII
jgi:hypothetical protein